MEDIFIKGASGSCVHDESPSFEVQNGSCVDELPSTVEDDSMEKAAEELLIAAQMKHEIFSQDVVIKAFYEAEKAHRGQVVVQTMRASGHPYLQHCLETAVLLASIGANSTVVAAGLLHDTVDGAFLSHDHYIFRTFGAGVSNLVEGVSKISQLTKLARENKTANKPVKADRLTAMFLAAVDARAILIKLADRLHNMITLDALSDPAKQQRFAKETLEIFVPLANRLGISSWKVQLESLCLKHLKPDRRRREPSSKLVDSSSTDAAIIVKKFMMDELKSACVHYESPSSSATNAGYAAMITSDIEKLEKALEDNLRLHGIYSKMLEEKLAMDK